MRPPSATGVSQATAKVTREHRQPKHHHDRSTTAATPRPSSSEVLSSSSSTNGIMMNSGGSSSGNGGGAGAAAGSGSAMKLSVSMISLPPPNGPATESASVATMRPFNSLKVSFVSNSNIRNFNINLYVQCLITVHV